MCSFCLGVTHTLDPGTHQLCYSLWGNSFPSEVGIKPRQTKHRLGAECHLGVWAWGSRLSVPMLPIHSWFQSHPYLIVCGAKWVVLVEDFMDQQASHGNIRVELCMLWTWYLYAVACFFREAVLRLANLLGLETWTRGVSEMVARVTPSPGFLARYLLVLSPLSIWYLQHADAREKYGVPSHILNGETWKYTKSQKPKWKNLEEWLLLHCFPPPPDPRP